MLNILHIYIGTLVIFNNGLVALWLFLLDRWQRELSMLARFGLYTARITLALQIVLGLAMIGSGSAGTALHYLFAIGAAAATWVAFVRSRRNQAHPLRTLALGCLVTCLLAWGAYVFGWR